ncbi:MAG: DUF4377 domain-containing protein [Gemmatimonadota bacterium]|nr:DUF4377 domain-containing protein [Gemmatimonadota bacterium]|tara:strand:+ start:1733 stop:2089 length:357 start_codon:yes stop_codon:yes gene_type:complete
MRKTRFLMLCALLLACGLIEPDSEELTLFVGPERVECMGFMFPTTCLQVRFNPEGNWETFDDPIEGFNFEPGFFYELRVRRVSIADPPADASSYRWILLELVNKIVAQAYATDSRIVI